MRWGLPLQEVRLLCLLALFSGHTLLRRLPLGPQILDPGAGPKPCFGWLENPHESLATQGHQPSSGPMEPGHSGRSTPAWDWGAVSYLQPCTWGLYFSEERFWFSSNRF